MFNDFHGCFVLYKRIYITYYDNNESLKYNNAVIPEKDSVRERAISICIESIYIQYALKDFYI